MTMQIQINYGDVNNSPAISDHVTKQVNRALKHTAKRITRVEVHLRDDKQKRGGPSDKRCTMEARIAGQQPIATSDSHNDLYQVITQAADKLSRAVQRKLERSESH